MNTSKVMPQAHELESKASIRLMAARAAAMARTLKYTRMDVRHAVGLLSAGHTLENVARDLIRCKKSKF